MPTVAENLEFYKKTLQAIRDNDQTQQQRLHENLFPIAVGIVNSLEQERQGLQQQINEIANRATREALEKAGANRKEGQVGYDSFNSAMLKMIFAYVLLSKVLNARYNIWELPDRGILPDWWLDQEVAGPEVRTLENGEEILHYPTRREINQQSEILRVTKTLINAEETLSKVRLPLIRLEADDSLDEDAIRQEFRRSFVGVFPPSIIERLGNDSFFNGDPNNLDPDYVYVNSALNEAEDAFWTGITHWLEENGYEIQRDHIVDTNNRHELTAEEFVALRDHPDYGITGFLLGSNQRRYQEVAPAPAPTR